MKVLVYDKGHFTEKEIDGSLKSLQNEVRGYIEMVYFFDELSKNKIDLIVNEDGKAFMSDNPNIYICFKSKGLSKGEVIYGPCLFASYDEHGNTVGLSDEQINIVKSYFNCDKIFVGKDAHGYRAISNVKYVEI